MGLRVSGFLAGMPSSGSFRILWNLILPLSRPAIATLGIFSFIWHWNDFMGPLIYLNTTEKFTISLGLRFYQHTAMTGGPAREHLFMAASLVVTFPCIVLFLTMQRQFIRGVVMSGLKF